jgi:hypothetical protein
MLIRDISEADIPVSVDPSQHDKLPRHVEKRLPASTRIEGLFGRATETIGHTMNLNGLAFFNTITAGTHYKRRSSSTSSTRDENPEQVPQRLLASLLSKYRVENGVGSQMTHNPS